MAHIPTVKIPADNARGFKIVNADDPRALALSGVAPASEPAEDAEPAGVTRTDIARMTKADLVDLAEAHGLDTGGTVAELREALTAAIFVDA